MTKLVKAVAALTSIVLGLPTIGLYVLLAALVQAGAMPDGCTPVRTLFRDAFDGNAADGARSLCRRQHRQGPGLANRMGGRALRLGRLRHPFPVRPFATLILMDEPLQVVSAVVTASAGVVQASCAYTMALMPN